jgi:hypothetical protein
MPLLLCPARVISQAGRVDRGWGRRKQGKFASAGLWNQALSPLGIPSHADVLCSPRGKRSKDSAHEHASINYGLGGMYLFPSWPELQSVSDWTRR